MRIKGIRVIDMINPVKWYSFVIGKIKKKLMKEVLEPHIIEQYMFRMLQCQPCMVEGKCIGKPDGACKGCGCDTWAKMMVGFENCVCGSWGPLRTVEDWNKIKQNINLKFNITYDKV